MGADAGPDSAAKSRSKDLISCRCCSFGEQRQIPDGKVSSIRHDSSCAELVAILQMVGENSRRGYPSRVRRVNVKCFRDRGGLTLKSIHAAVESGDSGTRLSGRWALRCACDRTSVIEAFLPVPGERTGRHASGTEEGQSINTTP